MTPVSFIEKNNRTTIIAIFAIVIVVAVVAVYLKVQSVTLFNDGLSVGNRQGFASFSGTLAGTLEEQEVLRGVLSLQGVGDRQYVVRPLDRQMTIFADGAVMMIELSPDTTVPQVLYGAYPEAAGDVEIVVNGLTSSLTLFGILAHEPETPLSLPLVPMIISSGVLRTTEGNIAVEYGKGTLEVVLRAPLSTDTVPLTPSGGTLVGTWTYEGADHPVTIGKNTITIEEFY